MNKTDINNQFKTELATLGHPMSLPNVGDENKGVYIDLIFGGSERPATRVKGGPVQREIGILTCNVHIESQADGGEDQANSIGDAIEALLPSGRRIPFTGGVITIQKPPEIRAGVPTDTDWYVPVVVSYAASPTN